MGGVPACAGIYLGISGGGIWVWYFMNISRIVRNTVCVILCAWLSYCFIGQDHSSHCSGVVQIIVKSLVVQLLTAYSAFRFHCVAGMITSVTLNVGTRILSKVCLR